MQEIWVQSLVQEDLTCCRTTKPLLHNKRSHFNEKPVHCNWRIPHPPQLEKARAATKTQQSPKEINKGPSPIYLRGPNAIP